MKLDKVRYVYKFLDMKSIPFATKLPEDLTKSLDAICKEMGLRKTFVVEKALREKIEDLLDSRDLREAIEEETSFQNWPEVKRRLGKKENRA